MNYSARRTAVDGVDIVRLGDAARGVEVSIASSIGNMAYEMIVGGNNFLWFPHQSPSELHQSAKFCAIPFLAPWANRLDGDAYWANGKRYLLNPGLGNLRRDANQLPIHGLLNFSPEWELKEAGADDRSAFATSRIEFGRHPDLIAQFPFAHTITMTHRLSSGELEVETALENHSADPMPVAIGFHPYFQLHGARRDQWMVHIAARDHLRLNDRLIPTGETEPVALADPHPLRDGPLDDVFTNLVRDPDGRARFWVESAEEKVTVTYGPKYTVAVIYAPTGHDFICFEPMAAITNGFNLAHEGLYRELQSVAPGQVWRESFWVAAQRLSSPQR